MTILVRADASPELGSGHVVRCANLVQRLRDAGELVVLAASERSRARLGVRLFREADALGSRADGHVDAHHVALEEGGLTLRAPVPLGCIDADVRK